MTGRLRATVIVVVAVSLAGCSGNSASTGRVSRESGLLDLEGRPFELPRTGIAVAIFARTDCPISNRYAPYVRELCETWHSRGVEFYLVYVDPAATLPELRKHLREFDYPCRGLFDPNHALVGQCGVAVTPEAAVFSDNRTMTYRGRIDDLNLEVGQARPEPTAHDLADAIEATVAGRPVAQPRTQAVGCPIADLKNRSANSSR